MEEKTNLLERPLIITALALLCCALWGSATPFIKIGYELMLPERELSSTILFAGIRFAAAGVLTVAIFSIARRRVLYPKPCNIPRVLTVGVFQTVIQYIFFYVGLSNTSGVKGTVASGSTAFFTVLISALIFRQEKLTPKKVIACIVGFAGIIVINIKGLDFGMNLTGDGFVIFSAIAYAISSCLMKRFSKHEDPVTISGYQFIFGGTVMIIIGSAMGGKINISSISALLVLLYLSALSAIAYSVWGMLLKHNHVSKVAVFSFSTPVFGVILSELMLTSEDNRISYLSLAITLVLICTGIFLLNYTPKRTREKN